MAIKRTQSVSSITRAANLAPAQELLVAALNYLHAPIQARWWRRTRLARRLKELGRLGQAGRTPQTPQHYAMALGRAQSTDGQQAPLPPSS